MAGSSTVLVTGSAGRIGQAVVRELRARGHAVRGFDLVPTPGLDASLVGDLSDRAAARAAAEGATELGHLAATPHTDELLKKQLPNNEVRIEHQLETAR